MAIIGGVIGTVVTVNLGAEFVRKKIKKTNSTTLTALLLLEYFLIIIKPEK